MRVLRLVICRVYLCCLVRGRARAGGGGPVVFVSHRPSVAGGARSRARPLLFLNETYSYIPKSPCKKLHSVLSVCPAQDIDEHVAVSKSQ